MEERRVRGEIGRRGRESGRVETVRMKGESRTRGTRTVDRARKSRNRYKGERGEKRE